MGRRPDANAVSVFPRAVACRECQGRHSRHGTVVASAPVSTDTDALLRGAVDAAPDGIVIVDDSGAIEFANPTLAQLFGYPLADLLGQPVEMLLPEDVRGIHVPQRVSYTDHPRTRPMGSGLDLHGRHSSGKLFPVEIGLSPVEIGAHTHVIAVVRDVTERRAAADELMQAREELALVDERERIARDLHDTVIQRLFAVGLSLQAAAVAVTDERTAERLQVAIDEIDGTIRDIRTAIFSLHARRLPTVGARDDVLATSREVARSLGFEPKVAFDGPVDAVTTDRIREHLVPTLREALSNVARHSGASSVEVSLVVNDGELILQIVDNGGGFDVAAVHGGRGIGNMRDRAEALGGACTLTSTAGGTELEWRVPLRDAP